MRQALVEFLADLLRVKVTFPFKEEDEPEEPAHLEYRIARVAKVSGEVYFYIDQYFRWRDDLSMLCSRSTHFDSEILLNGKPAQRIFRWERFPTKYNSMEEAVDDLNNNIRADDVIEESYFKAN